MTCVCERDRDHLFFVKRLNKFKNVLIQPCATGSWPCLRLPPPPLSMPLVKKGNDLKEIHNVLIILKVYIKQDKFSRTVNTIHPMRFTGHFLPPPISLSSHCSPHVSYSPKSPVPWPPVVARGDFQLMHWVRERERTLVEWAEGWGDQEVRG